MTINRPVRSALVAAAVFAAGAVPLLSMSAQESSAAGPGRSAVFGGIYSGGQPEMDALRQSGFTTVVLWTIHVDRNSGDLIYNDNKLISNGAYVGLPGWPAQVRTLKQAPTSVNRVEITVGSAGVDDWGAIHALIDSGGTGAGSVLYRNFQTLKQITGADAIDNDDETHFDVGSASAFSTMVSGQGYAITFAPYNRRDFWVALKNAVGGAVDRVYLQEYAGGSGNNPADWNAALGLRVDPGMWSRHGGNCAEGSTPQQVRSQFAQWHAQAGVGGGFMWLYDDMKKCPAQGSARDYADAINQTTGG